MDIAVLAPHHMTCHPYHAMGPVSSAVKAWADGHCFGEYASGRALLSSTAESVIATSSPSDRGRRGLATAA